MKKRVLVFSLLILALVVLIPLGISFVNNGGLDALTAAAYSWAGAAYSWAGAAYSWAGAAYSWAG